MQHDAARRGTHTGDPHRGPTQRGPTQGTHTGDPHRGPAQGTHTGDPHRAEGPTEDPPPEGRATQGTHTEHTQTTLTANKSGILIILSSDPPQLGPTPRSLILKSRELIVKKLNQKQGSRVQVDHLYLLVHMHAATTAPPDPPPSPAFLGWMFCSI